jgi:dienelactone hydrolase
VYRIFDRFALDRSLVLLVSDYTRVGGESVVADEPCEAASGCEAVVKSASTVNQAYRVYRICDRFALDRSLVLLVSDYTRVGGESVVADEPCEATSGCAAVVKSACTVNQANRVYRICDRYALDRSLVLLVSDYTRVGGESVVADEPCEAAFGCAAVVKSACTVYQARRVYRICDRFALDRSLVLLVSDYTRVGGESVVADEPCEAASGCAAVVKSACTVNQARRVYRSCDRYALDRSLVPSAATTGFS